MIISAESAYAAVTDTFECDGAVEKRLGGDATSVSARLWCGDKNSFAEQVVLGCAEKSLTEPCVRPKQSYG